VPACSCGGSGSCALCLAAMHVALRAAVKLQHQRNHCWVTWKVRVDPVVAASACSRQHALSVPQLK
jgi:hypothetical protein